MQEIQVATKEDFEELSQVIQELVLKAYASGMEQAPAFIAVRERTEVDGKPVLRVVLVGDLQTEELGDRGKDFIAFMLQRIAAEPEVLLVGYASEAWSSTTRGVAPSEDPNRTEVLLLNLLSAECQALRMIPIVRGENGVALGESELKFVGADTQFSGRFAREAPPVKH